MVQEEYGNTRCWRCGMMLPWHELRMLDSQMHCAFCYQDVLMIREEEKRAKNDAAPGAGSGAAVGTGGVGGAGEAAHKPPRSCEVCGNPAEHGQYAFSGKFACSSCYLGESRSHHGGFCTKCGSETKHLYLLGGEQLCITCFNADSGLGKGGGWATAIRERIEKLFKIRKRNVHKELNKRFRDEVREREKRKRQTGKEK